MRKLTTTIFLGALCLGVFAENNSVFECNFNNKTEFNRWTVIDNNHDGTTWDLKELSSSPADSVAAYGYSGQNAADDWLISPALTVTESGYYLLEYYYLGGSSSGEKMDVFYGTSNTVEGMNKLITDLGTFSTGSNLILDRKLLKMETGQTYYIGFHAKSDANKFRIYVDNVRLTKATSGIDASVTKIVSPVTDFGLGQEEVTVTVKNLGAEALVNFPLAYSVNQGSPVKENYSGTLEAGATANYTFSAKVDLSTPLETYTLRVWTDVPGEFIPANDTCTAKVKHRAIAQVPYFMGFEANEETDLITTYNLNDDTGTWSITTNDFWASFSNTGEAAMVYDYDKNNAANDWFILEPISLKAGYYSLKFWYSTMGDHPERLGVYYGTEKDPAKLTNTIVEYSPLVAPKYQESANVVNIKEDGIYYFGFKAFSDKDENVICIDDISLDEIKDINIDVAVSSITNPENGYVREQSSKDIVYSVTNNGIYDMDNCKLTVKLDETVLKEETIELTAQQTIKQTIADGLKDLPEGKHMLRVEIAKEGDTNTENNVMELSFRVVASPTQFWDFEDGKVPETFTLVNKDGGTVNNSLSDYFPNNEIWTTIELNPSPIYGSWMIGSASYLDNAENADRWLILPRTTINGDNACLIWSACSMDGEFPEDYEIMISETDGSNTDNFTSLYKKEKEVDASSITSRGIELGAYSGKTVYLAFRHTTKDGYVLVLDNIGIYNNEMPDAIKDANTGNNNIRIVVDGTILKIQADKPESVKIYNLSGSLLMQSENENQLSISQLENGVYTVVVKTESGQSVHKFVKK